MAAFAQLTWSLLTNPNIVYLFLVFGLWMVLIAAASPGTGLAEAAAVALLTLAAIGLLQLPVNLVGGGLIGLALVFYCVELYKGAHGAFALAGTLAFGLGSLALFRAESTEHPAQLSGWLVAGVTLLSALFFGGLAAIGLRARSAPTLLDLKHLIGARGVARTDVNGEGAVYVGGELWSARADDKIVANTEIVVVERDGLRLKVASAKRGH
jgi:membrane-bound serine protease (ClpP class)